MVWNPFRRKSPPGPDLDSRLRALEAEAATTSDGQGSVLERAGDLCWDAGERVRAFQYFGRAVDVHLQAGESERAAAVCRKMVELDPDVVDRWGIPVLRFHYQFGDNERMMAEDMATTAREMFEAAGIEVIGVDREVLTEGWSIHELGTARMGADPRTSVLNQHQQSHDVRNLFVVDGSSHVSASCQNPTWTIMALAWRSCEYLAEEFRKGNL